MSIPEVHPEDVKFDRETIEALGNVYAKALLQTKKQANADQSEE